MSILQPLLVTILVILFAIYWFGLRTRLADQLVILVSTAALAMLIFRPDWSDKISQSIGIGRGVDLLFYLAHAFTAFVVLVLFINARRQEARMAILTRHLAHLSARPAETTGDGKVRTEPENR